MSTHDLKEIFRSITPDNIKDIPVIRDSMDIFIDILKERSKQSIDLSTYMDNREIRRELFKTYLSDLYNVLDGIKDNQKIIDLITKRNEIYQSEDYEFISRQALEDMLDRITDEHFVAFKSFREKKGTIKGIEYIFQLIATLVNTPDGIDYVVIEGENPFELSIEGTLPPEFYYFLIAPLAHPAGFTYSYAQAVTWELIDYFFPIEIQYTVKQIIVNCITYVNGNSVKKTIDFSDRSVIDIKKNEYTWPKTTKIFFGDEHKGEYLENLIYANGDSTVSLIKEVDGELIVLNSFGDYCTLTYAVESIIIQDPDFDKMISSLIYPYDKSYYNYKWDDENGVLIPSDDTIVEDIFDSSIIPAEEKTPYLSWDTIPFWNRVGFDPFKWSIWNGRGYPDSGVVTRIAQETDKFYGSGLGLINPEVTLIGDPENFILGKQEYTKDQALNEFISEDIPQRFNSFETGTIGQDILYGITEYGSEEVLLTQPGRYRLDQASISGDAFHMTYVDVGTKVNEFIIKDSVSSYIVPDCFELENSQYTGSEVLDQQEIIPFHTDTYDNLSSRGTNKDSTIRVNSFIVRDDDYSFVLMNDLTTDNITTQESVQISSEWNLGSGKGSLQNTIYVLGEELNIRVPKWEIPKLKDSYFDIGNYNKIGVDRYDIQLHNVYGTLDVGIGDRVNIIGEYELIGGSNFSNSTGFWNNAFHQLSDDFEFGVFRDGVWLPDNNANQPVLTDLSSNYSDSLVNGNIVQVFTDNSDKIISVYEEITHADDYEISFNEELGYHRYFTENSDNLITSIFYNSVIENYEYSYGETIYINSDYEISELSEYIIGSQGFNRIFNERSDEISFTDVSLSSTDYSKSYETYYLIGTEDTLGVLSNIQHGLIGTGKVGNPINEYIDAFTEDSDMYCSFDTFDGDGNSVPNYVFKTKTLDLQHSDYRINFNKLLLIGNEYIGENLINPVDYIDAFTEDSDSNLIIDKEI